MSDIKLIVTGVDGSDSSKAALNWAYDEASHHGAALSVVMTWQPPSLPLSPPFGGALTDQGFEAQPRVNALAELEAFVADLVPRTPAVDVRTSIEEGNPVKVLLKSSKKADLLVVGSRGRDGFKGMLLGSVSQHLVAHAACPVVVIR